MQDSQIISIQVQLLQLSQTQESFHFDLLDTTLLQIQFQEIFEIDKITVYQHWNFTSIENQLF